MRISLPNSLVSRAFTLVFAIGLLQTPHARAAAIQNCYDMAIQLAPDLKGTAAPKITLPIAYDLCTYEESVSRDRGVFSGKYRVSIRDGDFLQKAYAMNFKTTTTSQSTINTVYAETAEKITGNNNERIQLSLRRYATGKGIYAGQISIAGNLYSLFLQ